jgi:uncharacterized protein
MLPTELLIYRRNGESLVPRRLPLDKTQRAIATDLIALFQQTQGQTQGELNRQLLELEGDTPDYRVKRGLAHLLKAETFSQFEIVSPLEPQLLRDRVFTLAASVCPSPQATMQTLDRLALTLSQELEREVHPDEIRAGLYADLNENRILTQFEAPTPDALLHRCLLSC